MRPLVRGGGVRQREYVTTRAKRGMSVADRINLHTEVDANGCWVWQLALVPGTGYGHLTVDRKVLIAHRASYETFVGPIPAGLEIDHLCRNRACVNPEHLEPVTSRENNLRSPFCRAHITHCPRGHAYDESNTYLDARTNRRQCRACRTAYLTVYRSLAPEQREARKNAGRPIVDLDAYFAEESAA